MAQTLHQFVGEKDTRIRDMTMKLFHENKAHTKCVGLNCVTINMSSATKLAFFMIVEARAILTYSCQPLQIVESGQIRISRTSFMQFEYIVIVANKMMPDRVNASPMPKKPYSS